MYDMEYDTLETTMEIVCVPPFVTGIDMIVAFCHTLLDELPN